jgi:hypothetical protein
MPPAGGKIPEAGYFVLGMRELLARQIPEAADCVAGCVEARMRPTPRPKPSLSDTGHLSPNGA